MLRYEAPGVSESGLACSGLACGDVHSFPLLANYLQMTSKRPYTPDAKPPQVAMYCPVIYRDIDSHLSTTTLHATRMPAHTKPAVKHRLEYPPLVCTSPIMPTLFSTMTLTGTVSCLMNHRPISPQELRNKRMEESI